MDRPEILARVEREALLEWEQHPVTQKVLEWLKECNKQLQEEWVEGGTLSLLNSDQTLQETTLLLGTIQGQRHILRMLPEVKEYIALLEEEATDGN
jgi:hypothetical protein